MSESTTVQLGGKRDVPALTSLRALAAFGVFLFHLGPTGTPLPGTSTGYVGVAFFYVLSGFVLTWGSAKVSPSKFYLRRFARIYPAFFVVLLIVVLVPSLAGAPFTWKEVLANVFLVQAWAPSSAVAYSVNGVAWSLSCEAVFYLLFPVASAVLTRVSPARAWAICGAAFAVASVVVVIGSRSSDEALYTIANVNPLVRLPEFLIGIAIARTIASGFRLTLPVGGAIVACAAAGAVVFHAKPTLDVWATMVCGVLIALLAQWSLVGRSPLSWRWLVYAGKISYCFYLVHQLVIFRVNALLGFGPAQSLVAFVVAVAAAVALHHLVEKPAHRAIVSRFRATRRTVPSDAVTE